MADVISVIDNLLKTKGISGSKMCYDLGMSRSFMTELRKGRAKGITMETAKKIADYFDVSVDYLLGKEEKWLMGYDTPKRSRLTIGKRMTKSISHNIRLHRNEAGLSTKQFADILGVDESHILGLESGEIELDRDTLYKICDALCLIPGNFIPRDDEELSEDEEYLLSRRQKETLDQPELTEGEQMLIDLFRQVPLDKQQLVLQMIRAALENS